MAGNIMFILKKNAEITMEDIILKFKIAGAKAPGKNIEYELSSPITNDAIDINPINGNIILVKDMASFIFSGSFINPVAKTLNNSFENITPNNTIIIINIVEYVKRESKNFFSSEFSLYSSIIGIADDESAPSATNFLKNCGIKKESK